MGIMRKNNKEKGFQTPQGDLFIWKYLAVQRDHTVNSGNPGDFISPMQCSLWEKGQLSTPVKPTDRNRSGIHGYWTFDHLVREEIRSGSTSFGHIDFFALVRCRIWGTVSFGRHGARAEHAQVVEAAITSDAYDLVTQAHPGLETRHTKFPFRYTFPEYAGRTVEEECLRMGFEIPARIPPAKPIKRGARPTPSYHWNPAPATPSRMGMGRPFANFRYGVYASPRPWVGKTIAEVRDHLGTLWQCPPDATAFKGRLPLHDLYVVQDGDNIEFHKRRS